MAAFWLVPLNGQQPHADFTPAVLAAVAPVHPPIAVFANVAGDVSVEAVIGSAGKVSSTKVLNGSKLLIHAGIDAAKRWRFQAGSSERRTVLNSIFRILPKDTPAEELSTIFTPPFSVEVRRTIPEQTVNDDQAQREELFESTVSQRHRLQSVTAREPVDSSRTTSLISRLAFSRRMRLDCKRLRNPS